MAALPAPQPATFAALFSDLSKDPSNGIYTNLLDPSFSIDLNTPANNTTPEAVKQQIAAAGSQRLPMAVIQLIDGRLQILLLPFRHEQAAGIAPDPAVDGKLFAYDGELIHGQGLLVEILGNSFHQLTNQVQVGTTAHINGQLATDTNPDFMMGPFAAADGNTEALKTRSIVLVPFKYVGLFMSQPGGIRPRYYFDTILPQIEADGLENVCRPLTCFCQIAITRQTAGTDRSVLEVPRPLAPPRNESLLNYSHGLLLHHFPQLNPLIAQANMQPIAAGITQLHTQRETQYNEAKQEKEAKEKSTVEQWLGVDRFKRLLHYSCVTTEAQLAQVWTVMAKAPQRERLGILQGKVRGELSAMGEVHLEESCVLDPNLLAHLVMLEWTMVNPDALETGCLGNLFIFGDSDVEERQRINKKLDLIQSGGASPSLTDAETIMKMKINLPDEEGSLRCVRRAEAVFRAVLPIGHPATSFISQHYRAMKAYDPGWRNHVTSNPLTRPLKGILHLHWLSLRLTQYFRKQGRSATPVACPDPLDILDKLQMQEKWEPLLSETFISRYNIRSLLQLEKPSFRKFEDNATVATEMSSLSGSLGTMGLGTTGTRGSTTSTNVRVDNTHFNESLFDDYKRSTKKSAELRKRIKNGELKALPPSKVDSNIPMCLAWHTKGQCNTGCPLVKDHVPYSGEEYVSMKSWCQECYNHE